MRPCLPYLHRNRLAAGLLFLVAGLVIHIVVWESFVVVHAALRG
jgi:hypothetical protein